MVLSLVDLSLRSITNGIKNGTIRHPQNYANMPPTLREQVFYMAMKQGLADHPNGLELLTSVDFLNGMSMISAKACIDNDSKFLDHLIASLATKLPNGETVGATIKELNLKVFDYGFAPWNFKNEETYSDVISKVSDLIAHCPNTTSLALHVSKHTFSSIRTEQGYWPLNENENIACNGVMENLVHLSVMLSGWKNIVGIERPVINFKQLKTLKLENCSFDDGSWPKLLEKIPFVENLHLIDVYSNEVGLDWILPFPLPHLKSLEVLGPRIFKCNKAFVDNLMECQQLHQVHLMLDQKSTHEESLARLASLNIDLKIGIRLFLRGNDAAENASILDSSSHFKLVRIFHEKMESFELDVWQEWNAQFLTALEYVLNTCSNLTSFGIKEPRFCVVNQAQIDYEEMKRFNMALIRFLDNPQLQLKGLRLLGHFDQIVLSAVFENCLNLVGLKVFYCSTLRDQHLIDWVSRGGGKLTHLDVHGCNNVTSEGIIPILAKSADGLLRCNYGSQDGGGRDWKAVMRIRCLNAR